jgi:proline iminopeptidase
VLEKLWRSRVAAFSAAIGASAVVGASIGLTMPRFPATASQALIVMTAGAGPGLVVGLAMRSRWAMLLAPLVSVLPFQVGRVATNVHGPTIDRVQRDTTYA